MSTHMTRVGVYVAVENRPLTDAGPAGLRVSTPKGVLMGGMRFLILAMALFLAACGSVQGDLQQMADRNWLSYAVGKPYASVAGQQKSTMEGLLHDDRAAGELLAASDLPGGDRLYRHVDRYQSGTTSSSFGGLVGKDSATYSYRLIYFRVSADGVVRDYANGFVPGETSSCVGWIGGIFTKCEDEAQLRQTVLSYDSFVKTSQGGTLSSWGLQI